MTSDYSNSFYLLTSFSPPPPPFPLLHIPSHTSLCTTMSSQLLKSKICTYFFNPSSPTKLQYLKPPDYYYYYYYFGKIDCQDFLKIFYKKRGTQRTGIKVFKFFPPPCQERGEKEYKSRFIAKKYVQKKEPRLPRDEKEGGTSSSQKEREIYIYLPRRKKDGLQTNPPPPLLLLLLLSIHPPPHFQIFYIHT